MLGALEKNKGNRECTFIWSIQGQIPEKGRLSKDLTEMRKGTMQVFWRRAFQAEKNASANRP